MAPPNRAPMIAKLDDASWSRGPRRTWCRSGGWRNALLHVSSRDLDRRLPVLPAGGGVMPRALNGGCVGRAAQPLPAKPGPRVKATQDDRTVLQCGDAPTGQAGKAEAHRIPVCESGTTRARRHRRGRNGSCPNPPLRKATQGGQTAGITAGFDRNATSDPRVTGMWNP